jgi:GNAT superfamily N-acetyltransferase
VKVIEFSRTHVEAAAEVVAELHSQPSDAGPASTLGDREAAREAVSAVIGAGPGVVAVDGSTVVGFMVAPLPKVPGPIAVRLGVHHHAVLPSYTRRTYRLMYEAIAEKLVGAGFTYHSLPVIADVPSTLHTFFELEFGIDQIKGAVRIDPNAVSSVDTGDVRVANESDVDDLLELSIELAKFHSRGPMLQAALVDVPSIRQSLVRSIEDDASTVLVVDDGRRPVSMMQAQPDTAYTDSVVIGMNVVTQSARSAGMGTAMLAALCSWAARRNYQYCTVGWTSSNLISDAFYRSRGFTPIRYRLHRRIDPRVAWANEAIDYSNFR